MINVVHIVDLDTNNYYLNNLVDFTDKSKIQFSFINIGPENEFTGELKKRGMPVYTLDARGGKKIPVALFRLRRLLKKINPDIVHTHLFIPTLLGLTVAKWQKRKTVLTRHHSDALYVIPSKIKRAAWLRLERSINRKSDRIIAPSKMVYDILVSTEHVKAAKVSLVPYGQTTQRFDAIDDAAVKAIRAELKMEEAGITLAFISRLSANKGHTYLFRSFASILKKGIHATLYLAGSGPLQNLLEKEAKELGISERVRFLGWRNDALAIMRSVDMIVHPSLEDALSSAVIESIMLEKPIVATDISGVRDSLADGQYGKIVEPANAEKFKEGILDIMNDLETATENAKKGRKYLLNYMSAQRVADEYTGIYQDLFQGKQVNN